MTLNHILRRNFIMRHMEVRQLCQESDGVFRAADLKKTFWLNPFIRSISGHSIRVFSDLEDLVPDVRFITLLRDPIKRYISHYIYIVDWTNKHFPFKKFLSNEVFSNTQTKAISGFMGVDAAKEYLAKRFWLVGIVEKFDEFLVLLRKKLKPIKFDPLYTRQNVSWEKVPERKETAALILEKYRDEIIERNQLDLQLFQHVHDRILPIQQDDYGSDLQQDLTEFQSALRRCNPGTRRSYIDYAVRKLYYDPLIGIMRKLNGLPYSRRREAYNIWSLNHYQKT